MSDLISRQAAIDAADAVWSVTGDTNVAKVWDQIKDLPSVQLSLEAIVHPQILDDAERRYLSAVTRPFRNKIKQIAKYGGHHHNYYYEYITVMYYVDQALITYSFGLPVFPEGTMYKGMKIGKAYTLEELGL